VLTRRHQLRIERNVRHLAGWDRVIVVETTAAA
jgi:hypothetical protein